MHSRANTLSSYEIGGSLFPSNSTELSSRICQVISFPSRFSFSSIKCFFVHFLSSFLHVWTASIFFCRENIFTSPQRNGRSILYYSRTRLCSGEYSEMSWDTWAKRWALAPSGTHRETWNREKIRFTSFSYLLYVYEYWRKCPIENIAFGFFLLTCAVCTSPWWIASGTLARRRRQSGGQRGHRGSPQHSNLKKKRFGWKKIKPRMKSVEKDTVLLTTNRDAETQRKTVLTWHSDRLLGPRLQPLGVPGQRDGGGALVGVRPGQERLCV